MFKKKRNESESSYVIAQLMLILFAVPDPWKRKNYRLIFLIYMCFGKFKITEESSIYINDFKRHERRTFASISL